MDLDLPPELQLYSELELDEEILAALEEGEEQIDRGEFRPWQEVKAELLKGLGTSHFVARANTGFA